MLYSDLKKMIAVCEMIRKGAINGRLNDFTEMGDSSIMPGGCGFLWTADRLFRFIEQTIDTELTGELAFIADYDKTKNIGLGDR